MTKYNSNRKNRYKLVKEPKEKVNRILMDDKLAVEVIMDCTTTSAQKFRARLGFKQYDVTSTLFRMGREGGKKPYQFFPCNFYKRRNKPQKRPHF